MVTERLGRLPCGKAMPFRVEFLLLRGYASWEAQLQVSFDLAERQSLSARIAAEPRRIRG